MAAPGTLTHVLEVAAQLAAVAASHAASLQHTASAVVSPPDSAAEAPLPPAGH